MPAPTDWVRPDKIAKPIRLNIMYADSDNWCLRLIDSGESRLPVAARNNAATPINTNLSAIMCGAILSTLSSCTLSTKIR